MTAELVHIDRTATLPEKMAYAEALAFSFMLPEQYRKQPANVLWAVEYGETIGITPMAAITGVHMIEGKPTASAALISGLVRRAGHRLRSGYDAATRTGWAEIVRCDDPEFTFRSEWDLDRAVEAELCTIDKDGKPHAKDSKGRSKPWKKFYPSMTKARAITEVARDACEEVLFGLHYTPEELGAETDDEGNLIEARGQRSRPVGGPVVDEWTTPAPRPEPAPDFAGHVPPASAVQVDDIEDAEVVGEEPAPAPGQPAEPKMAAKNQLTNLTMSFTETGITDRAERLRHTSEFLGREVPSFTTLTAEEYQRLRKALRGGWPHIDPSVGPGPAPGEYDTPEPEPLPDNPVRDVLKNLIAEADSPAQLADAGRDIAKELTRGNITPGEADDLRGQWSARNTAIKAGHAMAGAA